MRALTYGITSVFAVPLAYAYDWCTDFRDDDPLILGAPYTRHLLKKTRDEVIWIQHYKRDQEDREGIRAVKLDPPDAWHLESLNDGVRRTGEYRLTKLGDEKTRLKIVIKSHYKGVEPESKTKLQTALVEDWKKYKAALESDYLRSQKAAPTTKGERVTRSTGRHRR